ncbi:MAG: gliding motility-associated C-terminal domain-containing protein [bacterium]|nr:gliding motility-associated C-terminal domain-containing protein [bacterium]
MAITLILGVGPVDALVIYRLGGAELPPPPEADSAGVEFVQVAWDDVDPAAGGELLDVDLSSGVLAALRRDPQVDIAPTIEASGGTYVRGRVNSEVWDGDTSTVWVAGRYLCAEFREENYFISCTDDFGTPGTANIDLGGLYILDRIRVVSGLRDPGKTASAVRIFAGLGMPVTAITHHPPPYNPWLLEVRDNRESILDIPIPQSDEIAFLQLAFGEHDTEWEIHDVEIYARGFVGRSTYTSNIIDFGRPMAWGEMQWSATKGERAKVSIQTRSGTDSDPTLYWRYTGIGEDRAQVTATQYANLALGEKAGFTHDRDHWSFWSSYDFAHGAGTQVVSPGPRQFLQFQVDFLPLGNDGGEVQFLEFRASEPLATQLIAEVWPVQSRIGAATDFTYVLRPTIGSSDTGFDRIEIQSLSLLGDVRDVRVGDESVPYVVLVAEDHRLLISIPRMEAKDSGALVELDFDARVLRFGSRFEGRVADSSRPLEVPQGVEAGDATGEYEGNTVAVETAAEDEGQLLRVRVTQGVATPNGDGINDAAMLSYEIFEITGTADVDVEIWDLTGRRVRLLHRGRDGIGSYDRAWSGETDAGDLVPPGIYPYSIFVDTDRERVRKVGLLYVTY